MKSKDSFNSAAWCYARKLIDNTPELAGYYDPIHIKAFTAKQIMDAYITGLELEHNVMKEYIITYLEAKYKGIKNDFVQGVIEDVKKELNKNENKR